MWLRVGGVTGEEAKMWVEEGGLCGYVVTSDLHQHRDLEEEQQDAEHQQAVGFLRTF